MNNLEDLNRIKWRSRRGLLENDLVFERFYSKHGEQLNSTDLQGLTELLDYSDNDLMDFILARPTAKFSELSLPAQHILTHLQTA